MDTEVTNRSSDYLRAHADIEHDAETYKMAAELVDALGIIVPGRIIAEFASAQDARQFAAMKHKNGQLVTVTAGINYLFAVRLATKAEAA